MHAVVCNRQDMAFYCVLCDCLSPVRDPSKEKKILPVLPECEQTYLIFFSASRGDSLTKISPHTRGNGWTKCLARHFCQLVSHVSPANEQKSHNSCCAFAAINYVNYLKTSTCRLVHLLVENSSIAVITKAYWGRATFAIFSSVSIIWGQKPS